MQNYKINCIAYKRKALAFYNVCFVTQLLVFFLAFLFPYFTYANNATYISLSSQIAKRAHLDIISNNIANKNTVGFQEDIPIMRDFILKKRKGNLDFSIMALTIPSKKPASLKQTNRDLDVAITGEGYFKILTPKGYRYTLDGSIFINSLGKLVNSQNDSFMDENSQEILIPNGIESISFSSTGDIITHVGQEKEIIGKLGVFVFSRPDNIKEFNIKIRKDEHNKYIFHGQDEKSLDYLIVSKALTESNTDHIKSLAELGELQNSFESSVKLLSNSFQFDKSAVEILNVSR